jgi:hypothetical protein
MFLNHVEIEILMRKLFFHLNEIEQFFKRNIENQKIIQNTFWENIPNEFDRYCNAIERQDKINNSHC